VANLVLSRSVARQRDIGVRAALGAGRLRLFQVLLCEALILGGCGGLFGLALGYWGLRAIPAVLTTSLPGISTVSLDWRVVAFTSVLALGSAAVFALVPLAAGLRRDLHDLLREGSRATGGRRQHRVQAGLVVTSVAFAFMLLVCAGLFVRSFTKLVTVPSGVGTTNVLSAHVRLPLTGYSEAARTRWFYRTLEERLRAGRLARQRSSARGRRRPACVDRREPDRARTGAGRGRHLDARELFRIVRNSVDHRPLLLG
jgi:predicted lysophospholipase L1 biosynthesis ABC-type transport system permease subunit